LCCQHDEKNLSEAHGKTKKTSRKQPKNNRSQTPKAAAEPKTPRKAKATSRILNSDLGKQARVPPPPPAKSKTAKKTETIDGPASLLENIIPSQGGGKIIRNRAKKTPVSPPTPPPADPASYLTDMVESIIKAELRKHMTTAAAASK